MYVHGRPRADSRFALEGCTQNSQRELKLFPVQVEKQLLAL